MPHSSPSSPQRTLGLLLGVAPEHSSFQFGLRLAQEAQAQGTQVYLYLLDDAIVAAADPSIAALVASGAKVSGCAYAARRRNQPLNEAITFGGLSLLNDIMQNTDRFVGFCH